MRVERSLVRQQRRRLHGYLLDRAGDQRCQCTGGDGAARRAGVRATSCEARLNVFSPLGDYAVEACHVLRSDNIVIYCEVVSTNFFWEPDNFILQDQGEVLRGRWISDISANVVFARQ
jgi:hypothetical protein